MFWLEILLVIIVIFIPYPVEAADKNLSALIASIPALSWIGLVFWLVFAVVIAPIGPSVWNLSPEAADWMEWARHHPALALGLGPVFIIIGFVLMPISWLQDKSDR